MVGLSRSPDDDPRHRDGGNGERQERTHRDPEIARLSDVEHSFVDVEPDDDSVVTDLRSCTSCHDPGPTPDIQHAFAGIELRMLDEEIRPGGKECGHQVAFVGFVPGIG